MQRNYENIKNQPTLREQQDSRLKAKRAEEAEEDSAKKMVPKEMKPVDQAAI